MLDEFIFVKHKVQFDKKSNLPVDRPEANFYDLLDGT